MAASAAASCSGRAASSRGLGGGFNLNWDGVWQVATQVTDAGWTAEFAIPFRTLRYASGPAQTWGVNFQRNIRHRNEQSYRAPLPRQFNLNRLSLAGELRGLEAPPPRNLRLNHDRRRLWSSNVRFAVLSDANTGLFIVYDDIEGFDRFRPLGGGRGLTVKYSHLLDLLN